MPFVVTKVIKMFVYFKVPLEDLQQASSLLVQALDIRRRYMADSYQTFPSMTARFLRTLDPSDANNRNGNVEQKHDDRMTIEGFFFILFFGIVNVTGFKNDFFLM